MTLRVLHPLLVLLILLCCGGCGSQLFGAKIETAKVVAESPSHVTAYVSVNDSGEPVGYLNKSNFSVYEDGVLLDADQVELVLLDRDDLAVGQTVLLLDLSETPSDEELHSISRGAAHFVEKVTTTQSVIVLAFDGSERPREVGRYARVESPEKRPLPPLAPFLSKDGHRDLNSNVLAAISGLSRNLNSEKGTVQYGTIVTLVRGPDLAERTSESKLAAAIKESGFEFFLLSPETLSFASDDELGRSGAYLYDSLETLPLRSQDLGMRVRGAWQSHYLLSYCSPSRSKKHNLRVKVDFQNEQGDRRTTSSESHFSADGFEAGCQPSVEPTAAQGQGVSSPPE
jgi:hypothetical protein